MSHVVEEVVGGFKFAQHCFCHVVKHRRVFEVIVVSVVHVSGEVAHVDFLPLVVGGGYHLVEGRSIDEFRCRDQYLELLFRLNQSCLNDGRLVG